MLVTSIMDHWLYWIIKAPLSDEVTCFISITQNGSFIYKITLVR